MEPINLFDFETLAKHRMPYALWDFVEAGAADEITLRRNRTALDEITLTPRFLVDVNNRDLSTTVLGQRISFPVMVAPAIAQREVHPEGERATARAAGAAGTLMMVPTGSGYSIEEVAEAATGPLWFQLYHYSDRVAELLVPRARAAGYTAICLTVDIPVYSPKERDIRNRFVLSQGLNLGNLRDHPELSPSFSIGAYDPMNWSTPDYRGLTWSRLDWLRSLSGLPLVIKGIRTVEDALRCVEYGVDGIVVSTHGGRQFDGTLSSIESLPAIADAVGDKLEVYFDSGIRRGTDVLKALALGARAVLIGRPIFWGLAVDGETGVRKVLEMLRIELDRAMAYCGCTSVAAINRKLVSLS